MKFIEEVKKYPTEIKVCHILFLVGIVAYIIMFLAGMDYHVTGYVAYTTCFIGAAAATTGLMKADTGAWKPAILDMILFIAIIIHHLAVYPH